MGLVAMIVAHFSHQKSNKNGQRKVSRDKTLDKPFKKWRMGTRELITGLHEGNEDSFNFF